MNELPQGVEPSELEASFLRFAARSLSVLHRKGLVDPLPTIDDLFIAFEGNGYGLAQVTEIGIGKFLSESQRELESDADSVKEVQLHVRLAVWPERTSGRQDPTALVGDRDAFGRNAVAELLRPVLEAVRRSRTATPSQGVLLGCYHEFRAYWERPQWPWKAMIPLNNFSATAVFRQLSDSVQLHPFTDAEKLEMRIRPLGGIDGVSPMEIAESHFKLLILALLDRRSPSVPDSLASDSEAVITAFRVLKRGDVGARHIVVLPLGAPNRGIEFRQPLELEAAFGRNRPYDVTDNDIREVAKLSRQVKLALESQSESGTKLALRRFNKSYARRDSSDRILDLTIALEASLLHGLRGELGNRMRLRGIALLSSMWSAKEVDTILDVLYKLRSLVVHKGVSIEHQKIRTLLRRIDRDEEIDVFTQRVEDLVRCVLRMFVERNAAGQSSDQIVADLDRELVSRFESPTQEQRSPSAQDSAPQDTDPTRNPGS